MSILDQALGGEAPAEPVVVEDAAQSEAPATEVAAEQAPATPDPVKSEGGGNVPLTSLLDEREKRQRAEAELDRLRTQQTQDDGEPVYIDPDIEQRLLSERLNISEDLAREKYGEELVDAAKSAAIARIAQSPAFQQEVFAQRNPYRFVVEWHKRETAMAKIADPAEVDEYLAWKAAKAADPAPQPAAAAAPAAAAPQDRAPRSIVAAPSAAGGVQSVPTGPGVAFDSAIK